MSNQGYINLVCNIDSVKRCSIEKSVYLKIYPKCLITISSCKYDYKSITISQVKCFGCWNSVQKHFQQVVGNNPNQTMSTSFLPCN